MIDIRKSAVYCGTYHKYNCGSIAGKWMRLADYKNKGEFLGACARVHKNERDPEFMFQDYENLPSSFYGESYLPQEIWDVLNAMNEMPMEKQDEFIRWCDDMGYEQDMEAIKEFNAKQKVTATATLKVEYATDELAKELEKMLSQVYKPEYVEQKAKEQAKETPCIKLSDGKLVVFEKPKMEKDFCFGYSDWGQGLTYERANELCRAYSSDPKYFINDNLAQFKGFVNYKDGKADAKMFLTRKYNTTNIYEVGWKSDYDSEEINIDNEEDKRLVLATVQSIYDKFKRQLENYVKRYGTEKLHVWTYWADE